MATTPNDPDKKRDLEQEMLMREVDEAVRTDDVTNAVRRFGLPVGIALVLGLAAFGGWLWWDRQQEGALEGQSELIIQAMDELQGGNLSQADEELAMVDGETSPGALASANMIRAAIALDEGRTDDAVAFYEQVVRNEGAPPPMRDAALVRLVGANYDNMDPQEVIDRLGPLAVAGNPWFGSAGELVVHAYLDQDKVDQAGPLMIEIAQNEDVPATIAARIRQLAGRYGFDAIDDVEELLAATAYTGAAEGAAAAQ
ncbi:tetratricopeptide repeat protein [Alteraurantiacibacter aquimixticola]|uniref:Tetratricopeptide repeat protein n=1 Tax=Alteraurantiacibacter aquimixticola TaxID=2489173 RepID=A0A4T3F0S5_9SPHN|nr:tetratricopeptide repeat protein [Alteraurantiacibacter aquimixticola]TIX50544.1 tetratricopeptide repeat protein [Alteraurantiacibacter aquimixticola]